MCVCVCVCVCMHECHLHPMQSVHDIFYSTCSISYVLKHIHNPSTNVCASDQLN